MTRINFKELKDRTESVYQRYDTHFAGKSRATRDIQLIDGLIAELEGLVEEGKSLLNGSRDPALLSVLDLAKGNLETYRKERDAIAEAQVNGPQPEEATRIIARANVAFGHYHRHFAGKERRTRDVRRLDEILGELEEVLGRMRALADTYPDILRPNVDVIANNIEMYRNERNMIVDSRQSGTPTEQADTLAFLANEQFKTYRDLFAGKSRHTRRPALLERMVAELKDIQRSMRRLKNQGLRSDANTRNLDIVTRNLELYEKEIKEIYAARKSVTDEQYAGSLGGEANSVMDEYRQNFAGKNRATRDLDMMSRLCDAMRELALQMETLQMESPTEMNGKNLQIVLDSWSMYEDEYKKIEEAKST